MVEIIDEYFFNKFSNVKLLKNVILIQKLLLGQLIDYQF